MEVNALSDGTTVTLKEATTQDLEVLLEFFRGLSPEDQRYLRYDVTRKEVLARLLAEAEGGRAYRVAAWVDDRVAGFGVLEHPTDSWQSHMGELRVLVAPAYAKRRLGSILAGHLVQQARRLGLQRIMTKLAGPQMFARQMLERYGFGIDAVLENHIKDREGNLHPLVIMSCSLSSVAEALRDFYRAEDWPDG